MKLSAILLQEKLESIIVSCHYGENSAQLNLNRPEFIVKTSPLDSGHLYITEAETLSALRNIPCGCCVVCIGAPPPECPGQGYTVMHVQEGHDIFDVFNRLGEIFEKYDNWERQLLQCVTQKTPMQSIVDMSMDVFDNQMFIVDSTLRQLAKSKHRSSHNKTHDAIAEDIENLTKLYASPYGVSDNDEATILWDDNLQLRVLTKALRSHSRLAIAVTIIETKRPFRESDAVLLDYMSYYVLMAFDYGHTSTSEEESPVSLATVLTQLLRKETVPIEKISNAQNVFGWKPEHSLCLFYVKTPGPEQNFTTRIYHCQQMERQFDSAVAIASLGEEYVVVANVSLSEKHSESMLRFTSILQKFDFVCGMSCEFNDLEKVSEYHIQAKYAYTCGSLSNPGKTKYEFVDYGLQFMLAHCCNSQDPEDLFPVGLKKMISHDESYGTPYLKTLTAYCDCKFNATHAAKQLNIHRTTFLDRFLRIRDFLKVDFENPSDRLHLLMSLELIKQNAIEDC